MIDANDYWVNNPLISDVNKALMYDNDIDGAVSGERERIIKLLEDECEGDWPKVIEMSLDVLIALIKGENK